MPKRTDIESVLILGAGPIVIGQACEFDYSGAQACKALQEEGYKVILVNSNPATIMTDPALASRTYIEPVEWRTVAQIIERERPDTLLPTMGGQTALNCALDLVREGILDKFGVEMIGASKEAIDKAEDRELFDHAMSRIGLETARSGIAHNLEDALQVQKALDYPCIIRPSFTLGGSGGGIAYNEDEFIEICTRGLDLSPTNELLIDESLLGWKEFEMEVVRDHKDNCIIICSIENVDAMGVHTGDSITVAPAQTLTDKEYQLMRNASIAVLREIGVETGGSNVQFAVDPNSERMIVVEMNPRVSRSSALASKATGFPIAKVAAKLAIGYSLDELDNEITGATPASFEPSIDYVVTKLPRFAFEKFEQADSRLTTQMKSVGEAMSFGRTFKESLQKALRSTETGLSGLNPIIAVASDEDRRTLVANLRQPGADRLQYIGDAFRHGLSVEQLYDMTAIDPWFLAQIEDIVQTEKDVASQSLDSFDQGSWRRLKRDGFSDTRISELLDEDEGKVRERRLELGVKPVYKRVDTCAAEFSAATAYLYSTYEEECEANPSDRKKIMVLGGGPNRIGQGIEFDYCCVHAVLAMREDGYETIMVNCNPETVSTDYDTSDRLYFEPITMEDVLAIVDIEDPDGVIVQFGGQTPLKLVDQLSELGVKIIGTDSKAITRAEDRELFKQLIERIELKQPKNATVSTIEEGLEKAQEIGYPIVVRPSFVLGGRAMEIVYNDRELSMYLENALPESNASPVLLDRFLDQAVEVDVEVVSDGKQVVVSAIMQHIEQAGVHSGDSACSLPPHDLSVEIQDRISSQAVALAEELNVVGLMNVQMAIQSDEIYILEVNPRASRTVPFVSKCIGTSLAKIAARCMAGQTLSSQGFTHSVQPKHIYVKESVFPFIKFPGVDPILGPEMKSTGEVMGVGETFSEAFYKASLGAGVELPDNGLVFLSVKRSDRPFVVELGQELIDLGFNIVATRGTANVLENAGINTERVNKVTEGRPDVSDLIQNRDVKLIINTTEGRQSIADSAVIRRLALKNKIAYTTTLSGGMAICSAIRGGRSNQVRPLQQLHEELLA